MSSISGFYRFYEERARVPSTACTWVLGSSILTGRSGAIELSQASCDIKDWSDT